ncbi:MAG: acetyl-CoA hydrolase/transferase family protein [Frankiaceae bacterium]
MRLLTETALATELSALQAPCPRVVVTGNFATPLTTVRILDSSVERYRLFMLNAQPGIPVRPGVTHETPFVGAGMRGSAALVYVPARLSLVPRLFSTTCPPDVVVVRTSTPRSGRVSLGTEVNILPAAIEVARSRGALVVAQLDANMPYTYGDGELDVDDIDLAVAVDEALLSPAHRAPDPTAIEIADRVAALVPDAATLQLGIGAVPDAVLSALPARRGLRVWTEMFSDGVLALDRAGALDDAHPLTTSFVFGSPDLYAWVDANPRVRLLRTETTNDPGSISRQPRMTSVNAALQVDLFAQANASRIHGRVYSGFGGQTDFIVGALHSDGGTAIVALPSWHPRADVSTVVPVLTAPVTSFQHGFVVSEQGAAAVWGSPQDEQARLIVDHVAHPSVRDRLREEGRALGLAL